MKTKKKEMKMKYALYAVHYRGSRHALGDAGRGVHEAHSSASGAERPVESALATEVYLCVHRCPSNETLTEAERRRGRVKQD